MKMRLIIALLLSAFGIGNLNAEEFSFYEKETDNGGRFSAAPTRRRGKPLATAAQTRRMDHSFKSTAPWLKVRSGPSSTIPNGRFRGPIEARFAGTSSTASRT